MLLSKSPGYKGKTTE